MYDIVNTIHIIVTTTTRHSCLNKKKIPQKKNYYSDDYDSTLMLSESDAPYIC